MSDFEARVLASAARLATGDQHSRHWLAVATGVAAGNCPPSGLDPGEMLSCVEVPAVHGAAVRTCPTPGG